MVFLDVALVDTVLPDEVLGAGVFLDVAPDVGYCSAVLFEVWYFEE